jgi:hypothetical protein
MVDLRVAELASCGPREKLSGHDKTQKPSGHPPYQWRALLLLKIRSAKIDRYQPITQVEIRFRPGQAAMSKKAREALDEMANALKTREGYVIEIQGFFAGGDPSTWDSSCAASALQGIGA